jgi:hypothetical protein
MQLPYEVEEKIDLFCLLEETARFLWKDWPKDMEVTTSDAGQGHVVVRGRCPHCGEPSVFALVTSLGSTRNGYRVGGMQCQGCLDYILVTFSHLAHTTGLRYMKHYPLGKPDERVDTEIPLHIAADFREALRCVFVDSWNATAEMCRRAIEASCIDLGIPKGVRVLEDMIDSLAAQQKITPHMKDVAHKVRLGGNRGAHPPEGGPKPQGEPINEYAPIETIEEDHAKAIVDFTRQFLHHVYVVPKRLNKYDFSKPKAPKA